MRNMPLEVIDAERVKALLSMQDCIDVMAQAMAAVSTGHVTLPPRMIVPADGQGSFFALMPAVASTLEGYGAKLLSLTPANAARGLPVIRGQFLLFEKDTGAPVAVLDAGGQFVTRAVAKDRMLSDLGAFEDCLALARCVLNQG